MQDIFTIEESHCINTSNSWQGKEADDMIGSWSAELPN